MKKLLIGGICALGVGVCAHSAFANQSLLGTLEISYSYADPKNCSADLVVSLKNSPLILKFARKVNGVQLVGTHSINTSISPTVPMGAEGLDDFYAYMSTTSTTLTVNSVAYKMQQLWIQASKDHPDQWISAFYLGENKECLVASVQDLRLLAGQNPIRK